jgi:hypothetical protein
MPDEMLGGTPPSWKEIISILRTEHQQSSINAPFNTQRSNPRKAISSGSATNVAEQFSRGGEILYI